MKTSSLAGEKYPKRLTIILISVYLSFVELACAQESKINTEYLSGKYNPAKIASFKIVPPEYASQENLYLHQEALHAFIRMSEEAKKAGFSIYVISATRDFNSQKYIWESKFNGSRLVEGKNLKATIPDEKKRTLKILDYSSMPGTSRHHWGTDIDIGYSRNAAGMLTNQAYESGEGLRFYLWLEENAARFGYCQPYKNSPERRNKRKMRGYQEEKWHWSYKPLAVTYWRQYKENSDKLTPLGFAGSKSGQEVYLDYVQNIHEDCQ